MELKKYKLGDIAKIEISGVDKKSVDGETPVRLCNFVDVYRNWAITQKLRKNAGTTERDGRNDAKRLCTNVVTVSDEVKPKKRKMQGKAEYSRRTVCKSLPKKM